MEIDKNLNIKTCDLRVLDQKHPDGNLILVPNRVYKYCQEITEDLTDSKGNRHSVVISREWFETTIEYKDFEFSHNGFISHKIFDLRNGVFQFNTQLYHVIPAHYSTYEIVLHCATRNREPRIFEDKKWYQIENLSEKIGYAPLYEICVVSRNNAYISNFIPDNLFFRIKEREKAVNTITFNKHRNFRFLPDWHPLVKNNYSQMNDGQAFEFLIDYMKRKASFMKAVAKLY